MEETAKAGILDMASMLQKSHNTHSAIFVEVKVDAELHIVRGGGRPHHQPENRAQPDSRRRCHRHRHGAA